MNKAFLVYGNDIGLVNKTIDKTKASNTDLKDPFGYLRINNSNLDKNSKYLMEESLAITLTGKNRLIHIHEPNISSSKIIQSWLNEYRGNNKLLISFYETPPFNIKSIIEKNQNVTTIKCYIGNQIKTEQEILSILKKHNIKIDYQAIKILSESLINDTQIIQSEIEKLITYHLPSQNTITSQEIIACNIENKQTNLDDATYDAANGKKNIDIKNYEPTTIISITLQHFNKLYSCNGNDANIEKVKPAIHFSRKQAFSKQLKKWSANKILKAIKLLIQAEKEIRNNYQIAKLICMNALHKVAKIINQ